MLGIGHRQDKYTKIKILAERSKDYNQKYDHLITTGLDPQQVASILQKEEYEKRHQGSYEDEPYTVLTLPSRPPAKCIRSEEQSTKATTKHIKT